MKYVRGTAAGKARVKAMAWLHTVVSTSSSLCCLAVSQLGVRVNCRLCSNVHRLSYLPPARNARGKCNGSRTQDGLEQNACEIQSADTAGRTYRRTRRESVDKQQRAGREPRLAGNARGRRCRPSAGEAAKDVRTRARIRRNSRTLRVFLYAMRAALSGEGRRKRALPHFTW